MPEEFINDIIAKTESATNDKSIDASPDTADTADTADTKTTSDVAADVADNNEEKNSSSTTEATDTKKVTDDSDSADTATAPSGSAEVEELASKLGWNKDHKGADAVDAATYILRAKDIQKTMRTHNKELKKQLTALNGSVAALKEHNDRVYQADIKRLESSLAKLTKEKEAAIALADVAKVAEIDQQIDDVKKDIEAPKQEDTVSDNPIFDEWVAENGWYLTDKDMAQYADTVAEQYAGAPADRIYALVRNKVAEVFPEKFESTDKDTADLKDTKTDPVVNAPKSPVEKSTRTDTAGTFTKADLSAEQVAIMNQFVKGGIMTEEQYVADIAKLQEN